VIVANMRLLVHSAPEPVTEGQPGKPRRSLSNSGSKMGVARRRQVRSGAVIVATSIPTTCGNVLQQRLRRLVGLVVVLAVVGSRPVAMKNEGVRALESCAWEFTELAVRARCCSMRVKLASWPCEGRGPRGTSARRC
jgi:hypothetical protein